MTTCGVDPGLTGGLAVIKDLAPLDCRPMFVSGGDIDFDDFAHYLQTFSPDVVAVERAQAMPKQGVVSMFNYGVGFGGLIGVCAALGLRCELVRPQDWKARVLRGTAKDKNAAIAYCRRAFPAVSLLPSERSRTNHHGMADALCLAIYAHHHFGVNQK